MRAAGVTPATVPFPPAPPRAGWRRRGSELTDAATALWARTTEQLGSDLGIEQAQGRPAAEPGELVALLTAGCERRLRSGAPSARESAELATLISELQTLAGEISEYVLVDRTRRLADCGRALSRLRAITTSAGLIDGVCDELVRGSGFARVMLARVEDGMWRPWKGNESLLNEAWAADWVDQAIPLDELTLETQLLTEQRPALIQDTNVPGIASMVHAAGVSSYVVAPIMPGGQVVGFFHADHGSGGRRCDTADRELLWTFAEGFGHLYERTALFEQLEARRGQVRRALSTVGEAMEELVGAELELSTAADTMPGSNVSIMREGTGRRLGDLTPRELEVLELIVAGARNQEISERLVITVGTVKSHVKNILAKLGAVNRSQAIAHYLGVTGDR